MQTPRVSLYNATNSLKEFYKSVCLLSLLVVFVHMRVLPEVAAKVSHNVVMGAFLHHKDLLLDDRKIITCERKRT